MRTLDITEFLWHTIPGQMLLTVAVSMVPVAELRVGIPFGTALGLPPLAALLAAVAGNLLPLPFIIVYIRRIFHWLRCKVPRLERFVSALERKAHLKGRKVKKYQYLGLFLFVAIPLPGTGGWTGALVAAVLEMRLKKAFPSICLGVLTAGLIMTFLTQAVSSVIS